MRGSILALVAALTVLAGCSPNNVRSMSDPNANFNTFETFSWAADAGLAGAEPTLRLLDQNIRASITAELESRGFRRVDQGGQMLMAYQTLSADRISVTPSTTTGVNTWGRNWNSVAVNSPTVRQYTEGTLVVSAIDATRNVEVWQGTISGRLNRSSLEAAAIRDTVTAVMADFPRR